MHSSTSKDGFCSGTSDISSSLASAAGQNESGSKLLDCVGGPDVGSAHCFVVQTCLSENLDVFESSVSLFELYFLEHDGTFSTEGRSEQIDCKIVKWKGCKMGFYKICGQ